MNIKIETLTPIHIGNGREVMGNFEYLVFRDHKKIAFIDENKIFHLIGKGELDRWISIIYDRGDLLNYLLKRKPDLQPEDIAQRVIAINGNLPGKENQIREQIKSGTGKPLLPGSSLKGALRTAIFTRLLNQNKKILKNNDVYFNHRRNRKGEILRVNRRKIKDSELNYQLMGRDPNHEFMQLVRVGDAEFDKTECILAESMNEYADKRYDMLDGQRGRKMAEQFVEALPPNSISTLNLKIAESRLKLVYKKGSFEVPIKLTIRNLFEIANQHTLNLVKKEIGRYANADLPVKASNYLTSLHEIEKMAASSACGSSECILRVGYGTGFRSMTGDWHLDMDEDFYFDNLIGELRIKHDLEFPKSRRMTLNGIPFGFVKLSMI